jgi:general stress protein 26
VVKDWFPNGKEDSGLVPIKVEPNRVEWWGSHSSKVKTGFEIAKAVITEAKYNSLEYQVVNL